MLDNNYYIHTTTTNKSAVRMYKELKANGVQNNKFFLRLYDKDLMNVNPLEENNLTPLLKSKVIAEIKRNPFYYIREVLRLPTAAGKIRYEFNRGGLALLYGIFNSIDTITVLCRQRGKTISVASALSWVYCFGAQNTQMAFGNKSKDDAINNLKRFKDIIEALPSYIRESFESKNDINNVESVLNRERNNSIVIFQPSINADKADQDARGKTLPFWWSDETAFHKFIGIVMASSGPAVARISMDCEREGKPHARILTTTPNFIDDPNGNFVKTQLIDKAAKFYEGLYDLSREELLDYIKHNSENDFLYIEYSWRELGLSESWYQKQIRILNHDWIKINREVNCFWSKASDNGVFDEATLMSISNQLRVPINYQEFKIIKDNEKTGEFNALRYNFTVYTSLDPNKLYYVGVDVAGGFDRDNSAIIITNSDFEVQATFKNSKINTYDLSLLLSHLVKEYPHMCLFIENNSYGKAVIDHLLEIAPQNIYFHYKISDKDKTAPNPKEITESITYGINTNTKSRELMFDMLIEMVNNDKGRFAYGDVYTDISTLIVNSKGKIEHEVGAHDDSLMAFMMILYAFEHTNNISPFIRSLKPKVELTNIHRNYTTLAAANFNLNDPSVNLGEAFDLDTVKKLVDNGMSLEEAFEVVKNKRKMIENASKSHRSGIENGISSRERFFLNVK